MTRKARPTRPKPNTPPAPTKRDPRSPDEWQAAVDAADFALLIDAAQQYGLVVGGPKVNAERCQDILAAGAEGGIFPSAPDRRRATIALWLWTERAVLGMPQHALGKAAGTHQVRISMIERGRVDVSNEELARLRAVLKAAGDAAAE